MSKEEWRDIKGYEGLYQVSNLGNVRSFHKGKVINVKAHNQNGWYLGIRLTDKVGRVKTARIHRLVANAFIGEIPRGYHVHHKDGNKQNNCVSNLEIIHPQKHVIETMKQNADFVKRLNHYNQYERPKRISQFTLDGDFIAEYANSNIAEELTGVCQRNILQVANNKEGRKQAGGYIWRFSE